MTLSKDSAPFVMFVALFTLYSPLAALPSYLPIVGRLPESQQRRLALGLFLYVSVFVLAGLWVGEVLLEVLGITTAALTATGGVALILEAVPLMLGTHATELPDEVPLVAAAETEDALARPASWRSMLLTPVTFPLTVGGATFGILVGFGAAADNAGDRLVLTVAGLAYAAVTGITLYASSHVHRRASDRARAMLDRIAGILLTAIAVTLLASGGTRLVVQTFDSLPR
jgi:multiple antibiotic resistance protein